MNRGLVELDYFWGEREHVPLERVIVFRDFLAARQRAFSVKRKDMCKAFFNEPLYLSSGGPRTNYSSGTSQARPGFLAVGVADAGDACQNLV